MNLAKQLWAARVEGRRIDISPVGLPADEGAAYDVQEAVSQVAEATSVGFKLGATSEASLKALGLTRPFFGPLVDRYFHHSGDEVVLSTRHPVLIETEIAVGLEQDLRPRDQKYTPDEVERATAWVAPALELVATRFEIELAGNGILLIADGGVNADFVLGDKVRDWGQLDLSQHPATLLVNDLEAASGHSGMSLFATPFEAVAWLANHPRIRARGLRTGDIITTGTCTGMTPLQPGDRARADLGELGELRMQLAALS